jgi:hypothetical protein
MPTSSAKPAKMLKYRNDGIVQVQEWEPEVGHLETALTNLRTALQGLDLPDECQVSVLFYETWFDSLTRNQRHLDEWVGDVANGFIVAAGGNPSQFDINANLNRVMTANDSDIHVGFADRERSEQQARDDAAALDQILGEAGLIHPYDLANDPELLERLSRQYPQLRDILARTARFAQDEDYGAMLVNTLGPQNVRTMVDLTNTFGQAQDRGLIDGDAYLGYVVPFGTILAAADRSGHMDRSVRDAIFDMDATDEPPGNAPGTDSIQEQALEHMRHRSLALLVSVGGFSSQTTADMANTIMHGPIGREVYGVAGDVEGFTNAQFLQTHQALATNRYSALVALQGDDHASNLFYSMDANHDGTFENLGFMGTDADARVAAERLGIPEDQFTGMVHETVANTLRGGILEYPLAAHQLDSPGQLNLVAQTIQTAGGEYMDTSGPVRQALAQVSAPYTRDLAIISAGGGPDLPHSRLGGLSSDDIGHFMEEVSESKEGRVALSQNAAALVRTQIDGVAPNIASGQGDAFGTGERLSTAYYTQMGESWDHVQVSWQEQREALVSGWRSVTDPVVDLVSGKIVEKIPVVNTAADLPLVSNVVDGVTGTISGSINDAVYDHLIPRPEIESMRTWDDAIGNEVRTAVATGLYDDPTARQHYLQLAQQDHSLWNRINADGHVSLDEFRSIGAVQNSVNEHAGEIIDGYESKMAFDKAFK